MTEVCLSSLGIFKIVIVWENREELKDGVRPIAFKLLSFIIYSNILRMFVFKVWLRLLLESLTTYPGSLFCIKIDGLGRATTFKPIDGFPFLKVRQFVFVI